MTIIEMGFDSLAHVPKLSSNICAGETNFTSVLHFFKILTQVRGPVKENVTLSSLIWVLAA